MRAIAQRRRSSHLPETHWAPRTEIEHYQRLIADLRATIATATALERAEPDQLLEVLVLAALTSIFGVTDVQQWSLHIDGTVSLADSMDPHLFDQVGCARYMRDVAAFMDIHALSLGRPEKSRRAWLKWRSESATQENPNSDDGGACFTSFEITHGIPESLVTLLAVMSAGLEDIAEDGHEHFLTTLTEELYLKALSDSKSAGNPNPWSEFTANSQNDVERWNVLVERLILLWTHPPLPRHFSSTLQFALTTCWEILRKAFLVFLWRRGFVGNILSPSDPYRDARIVQMTREALMASRSLLDLRDSHNITIANALLWPLVVFGNECHRDPGWQAEVLDMLSKLHERSALGHIGQLTDVLQLLWQRELDTRTSDLDRNVQLSLDDISREMGFCLLLV
jgi:hypothetical protein